MVIEEIVWPEDRIEHIRRHGVTPEEVEEVCFGRPLLRRAKSLGDNPVYYAFGRTSTGRYQFWFVFRFPDSKGFPVTARSMTETEKRRFRQWLNR